MEYSRDAATEVSLATLENEGESRCEKAAGASLGTYCDIFSSDRVPFRTLPYLPRGKDLFINSQARLSGKSDGM